jgi:hypothetical protein
MCVRYYPQAADAPQSFAYPTLTVAIFVIYIVVQFVGALLGVPS